MTYRQLLRSNADFRRLWLGQVVSEVGDWLNNIAVLALAIELAGERRVGLAIAVYAIARHLPLFVFGPVAGVVVDRLSRRRVMIAADLLRAALALGFIAADRQGSLLLIYAVGAAIFSVSAFFNAAKRAAVPNIVEGTEQLLAANSLTASTTAATIAVGSALGGVVATFAGRTLVFVLNALTFLVSAELIRRIRTRTEKHSADNVEESATVPRANQNAVVTGASPPSFFAPLRLGVSNLLRGQSLTQRRKGAKDGEGLETRAETQPTAYRLMPAAYRIPRHVFTEFRDGLRYVRRERVLSAVFVVAAGWGLGNGAARALYSIFGARLGAETLGGWGESARALITRPSEFGISVLFVAMGLGGVLGAPLARRFNRAGDKLGARLGRSMTLDGCGLALFSLMPNLWAASLVLVAREMNFAIWWTAQQTLLMRRTEDAYAGRVFASYETLTTLMMVGSMLASGAAADRIGIRPVALCGGLVITFAGLLWFVLRRRDQKTVSSP
jgi:MFS family permease